MVALFICYIDDGTAIDRDALEVLLQAVVAVVSYCGGVHLSQLRHGVSEALFRAAALQYLRGFRSAVYSPDCRCRALYGDFLLWHTGLQQD